MMMARSPGAPLLSALVLSVLAAAARAGRVAMGTVRCDALCGADQLQDSRRFGNGVGKERSTFDDTEAQMMIRFTNAAYYFLSTTSGKSARDCLRSPELDLWPGVEAEVVEEIEHKHKSTAIGALVLKASFNGSAKQDVVVTFPGTNGKTGHRMLQFSQQLFSGVFSRVLSRMHRVPQLEVPHCDACNSVEVLGWYYKAFLEIFPHVAGVVRRAVDEIKGEHGSWTGRLIVGGLSMGGALAAISAPHLQQQLVDAGVRPAGWRPLLYSFGQPRIGNRAFALAVMRLTYPWRITHAGDPVVHFPGKGTSNTHFGPEVFYGGAMEGDHTRDFVECNQLEDEACSNSVPLTSYNPRDHKRYYADAGKHKCY